MIKKISKKSGFSLIELLVVISIMAVLTAVLVANFVGARDRAKDSKKIQDMTSFKNALRMYYNDNQSYPGTVGNNISCSNLNISIGSSYMPGLSGIDSTCLYTLTSGDAFTATVQLDSGAGANGDNSQKACGLTPTPSIYAICSN
jgi:prepilin-type N-terminal cleavage/methylation domain-containing protein